jgi:hypothetical protein
VNANVTFNGTYNIIPGQFGPGAWQRYAINQSNINLYLYKQNADGTWPPTEPLPNANLANKVEINANNGLNGTWNTGQTAFAQKGFYKIQAKMYIVEWKNGAPQKGKLIDFNFIIFEVK